MPQQSEFIGFTRAREKTKTHYWVDAVVTDFVGRTLSGVIVMLLYVFGIWL